jgi:hypothetical protein
MCAVPGTQQMLSQRRQKAATREAPVGHSEIMIVRPIISVLVMVTISPLLVILTLTFSNPAEFGGNPDLQSVLMMYMFALITVPLWITYIPSIILTPIVLHKMRKKKSFYNISIFALIALAGMSGALIGELILAPLLFLVHKEPNNLFSSWILSGAVSGSISLTIIVLIYRFGDKAPMGLEP